MIGTAPFEQPSSISSVISRRHLLPYVVHPQLCFSHDYQTGVNLITTVLFPILSSSIVDVAEEVRIPSSCHLGASRLDPCLRILHPQLPPRRPRHLLLHVHSESPSIAPSPPSLPTTSTRIIESSPANSSTRPPPRSAPKFSATSASGSSSSSAETPTRRCENRRFWRWVRCRTS